ncbi:MAG: hypothetical protein Q4G09_04235 [Clostridia bacterium]|nr:hypothetical protein [Clostridia bacterium]
MRSGQKKTGIIIEKGKTINEKVTILNNIIETKEENFIADNQVNVVLRSKENEAIGIIKLLEESTEYSGVLDKDIIANYIFLSKGVEIDNMKFKIEITEKEINDNTNNETELQNEI